MKTIREPSQQRFFDPAVATAGAIESITLMDDTPAACALGGCSMYVDLLTGIAVPEPASALLFSAGLIGRLVRRRVWGPGATSMFVALRRESPGADGR